MNHEHYIRKALKLALKGGTLVHPNPMVGAVLVKNKRIIAVGYHSRFGGAHAEIEAIQRAKKQTRGSTLYVTLEPCSTFGKTPLCVKAIIQAGICKVIIAEKDSNPRHRNRGIALLKKAGIDVVCGVLEEEAHFLNRAFHKYMMRKMPYIRLKLAMSLDGKIATKTGDSKWISSEIARDWVQDLRKEVDAVLIGINTLLKDDPRLNIRKGEVLKQPYRIILDTHGRISLRAKILKEKGGPVLLAAVSLSKHKRFQLEERNVTILDCKKTSKGQIDLKHLFKKLTMMGIIDILVEGGGQVTTSLVEQRLVDQLYIVISPKLIGSQGTSIFMGSSINKVSQAIGIKNACIAPLGPDFLLTGTF